MKHLEKWFDIILSLAYLGQELNRTIILPAIYCRSTPNQVKALLTRYIQQSLLHHKEYPFTLLKRVYNYNITYQELESLFHYPQFFNREFLGENNFKKIKRLLNGTVNIYPQNEYEYYSKIIEKLTYEKIIERNERNAYQY